MTASLRLGNDGSVQTGSIEGDIDLASAHDLSTEIMKSVPNDADGLVLDLTEVRYLDSTGVSMLLDLQRSLSARRQKLGIVLPRISHLWRVFEITGLPSILSIGESLADAKAATKR